MILTRLDRFQAMAIALLAAALAATPALGQEKVTYNMSWLPQGSSSGIIVAQERGFYRELGLDVAIVRGYGGSRTANELDQGQFEFGYVDPISVILNRSNGGRIKMVGAINTHWPAGICWVTSRMQPKGLDDLRGKTLGGGSASVVHNIVPAWLEMNGKQPDLIKLVRMDPAVVDTSLIGGKIELAECWKASNRPVLQKLAREAGVQVAWMDYSAFGLNAYGSGFATTEALIAAKPETVRKFLRGAYRGFEFAAANPEQAADIITKVFPTADRGVVLAQTREIAELINDGDVRAQGLGYMREDRMRASLSFIEKAFKLKEPVKLDDVYTNGLLK